MTTHQSGVKLLIICSGLALIWSAQSQLTHSSDSCGDIICPGSHVLYTCTFPIRGSVIVVWRMKPECELNIRDITFIRSTDNRLNTMCDDRRTIEVQGMDTPNGTVFVSTLNVTNMTRSQTVECIFDDGSTEESIGINRVLTTAPAQGLVIADGTPNLVLTLNQSINCPLIEYAVNTSTNCGMCGTVIDDTITCTNAQVGSICTVEVESLLCGFPVNQTVITFNITNEPSTLSTTDVSTQKDEIIVAVVVPVLFVAAVVAAIIVAVIVWQKAKQKDQQGKPLTSEGQYVELEGMKRDNTKPHDDLPVDCPESVQDKTDQRGDSYSATPVADSSNDTEGKSSTDENQSKAINSSEGAGSRVQHLHGSNSGNISTAYETSTDGPGLIVTGSATMKSASAASSTKTSESSTYVYKPPTTSYTRSSETQIFSSPLGEVDHNPAQQETGGSRDLSFDRDQEQLVQYVTRVIRDEAEKTRDKIDELNQKVCTLETTIEEKTKEIQNLKTLVQTLRSDIAQMKDKDEKKTAKIEQLENKIEELTKEKEENIKELNRLTKR